MKVKDLTPILSALDPETEISLSISVKGTVSEETTFFHGLTSAFTGLIISEVDEKTGKRTLNLNNNLYSDDEKDS